MKALTIRQPWAQLIIEGYKEYEFRSRNINYRGKILIHAGKTVEKDMLPRFEKYSLTYTKGAIIGEAIIEDCILVDDEFNKELYKNNPLVYGKNNHANTYAWKLTGIKKYEKPIEVKGQLGLWNYKENK